MMPVCDAKFWVGIDRVSHGEGSAAPSSNVVRAGARRAVGKAPAFSLLTLGAAGNRRAPFEPFRAGGGEACLSLLPFDSVQPRNHARQHKTAWRFAA